MPDNNNKILLCLNTGLSYSVNTGLWQDNMVISAFSNVQKQYLVIQRQFMPQMVVHGGTKLERQNH